MRNLDIPANLAATTDNVPKGRSGVSSPPERRDLHTAYLVNASLFSPNSMGACPECRGLGVTYTDLAFMDGIVARCQTCHGRRFTDEAQQVFDDTQLSRVLTALFDVGLGYLTLGQPLSTLSGGECQRVKLAAELQQSPANALCPRRTHHRTPPDRRRPAGGHPRPARRRRQHRGDRRAQPRRGPTSRLDHRSRSRRRAPWRPCPVQRATRTTPARPRVNHGPIPVQPGYLPAVDAGSRYRTSFRT